MPVPFEEMTKAQFLTSFDSIAGMLFIKQNPLERATIYTNILEKAETLGMLQEVDESLKKKAEEYGEPELWELPESFEGAEITAKFPLDSLPDLLRDYLKAVAAFVQVTPEMAALPLLSVLSLCVQGKAVIKNIGNSHTEPLNLYTLTVAPPGSRKSGSLREFIRPVNEFQRHYNEVHAADFAEYRTRKQYLERQQESATKGKNSDVNKAVEYSKKLLELEQETKYKSEMLLNISDVTPEALAWTMFTQCDRMGVIDDEASIFDVLSGIYSSGQPNINIFLKAYDGSPCTVVRCARNNIELKSPLLSIGLMTQTDHFRAAMNNKQFTGRGFIHRFLFAFPESTAGSLKPSSPDIPEKLQAAYNDLIVRLLRMPVPALIPVIKCGREAELLFLDYHEHIQRQLRGGGMFENLPEWASKQFARALRIAGILHLCEHKPAEQVTGETAVNAISISMWAENCALIAFGGGSDETAQARYIYDRLKKCTDKPQKLHKRELLRLCRKLKRAEDFEEPLKILEDMKIIRREFIQNGAGRPREVIKVNPLIYID